MAGYVCIFVMLHPIEKYERNVWPTQDYRKNWIPKYYQSNYVMCSNYQKINLVIQFPGAKNKLTAHFAVHNDQVMKWSELQQSSHRTSVQFSSVAQPCLILCDPVNHSTLALPVHHQLLESTQSHVHRVGDAIQPSHPLSSPSPPALNLSQHQGLFKWVSSSHQVAKVLEFQLQHQSFQWTPRTELL